MKDLYQVLGVKQNASMKEIQKAYRKLALFSHPDRGGDTDTMGVLNEAYETLSDSAKRGAFDSKWGAYQEASVDTEPEDIKINEYLQKGNTQPYSRVFREEHKAFVKQYEQVPLGQHILRENFKSFESVRYQLEIQGLDVEQYHDIFTFIEVKTALGLKSLSSAPTEPLTPVYAIKLFIDFLSGNYWGSELTVLKKYLASEMKKIKMRNAQEPELLLYQGIFEIFLITNELSAEKHNLIFSIKKITDFSNQATDLLLSRIIPLFYNHFFRSLYAYSLHLYWYSSDNLFEAEKQFDGRQEAKALLTVLKERLSNSSGNENLARLIRYVKLLYNFEKDFHDSNVKKEFNDYREKAFHILDWIPSLIDKSSRQILVNIFLQIGIQFQLASQLETQLAIKMADEKLALKMYLTAIGIGHHSTPDVELYANTQALKYLLSFQFDDSTLEEAIPALTKRALMIADVFPFFENLQSNVAFLRQENKMLHLMRRLLKAMIDIHEYNKSHSDRIIIDHSATTLLYQAYEACLKNWYQEEYDPATEQHFRLELMDELLFDNAWTFLDVEQQIDSPWIMVDRDEQGWLKPSCSLPYSEEDSLVNYSTIDGVEINPKTGEINFFMTPWDQSRPVYEKLFSLFDLQEMLEKNVMGAIFSLDPVDPDKPYHPFNLMRFSPAQLCESELLNTMLLTDYLLKFLTTDQEVQGQYPFGQRPAASMIQHLPEYLRKIIEDFHHTQHSGALHRFWIEAEDIDLSLSDETKDDVTRVGLRT
jgi:hypothetical protein